MARIGKTAGLAERGVWVAPWMGPDDEVVLLAVTSRGRLATDAPVVIPNGASRIDACDRLWDILEAADPDPKVRLRVI